MECSAAGGIFIGSNYLDEISNDPVSKLAALIRCYGSVARELSTALKYELSKGCCLLQSITGLLIFLQ